MEPISTLIFVLYKLLEAIIVAKAGASRFKFKLQLLQTRVEILIKKLEEINKLGPQMQDKFPNEETLRLSELLEGAKDVISSCSNARWYKFNGGYYENQIDIIAAALDEFLRVDLALAQYLTNVQVLAQVTELTKKLNLKSSSGTTPHSSQGSPSSSENRPGIATPPSSATTPLTPGRDYCESSSSSSRKTRRFRFKLRCETEYTSDKYV